MRRLSVAEGDSSLRQIIRRQFQCHFVARQDADAIPSQPPGQVSQYHPFVVQLHTEKTAGEFLQNGAGDFDAVLFTHIPLWDR